MRHRELGRATRERLTREEEESFCFRSKRGRPLIQKINQNEKTVPNIFGVKRTVKSNIKQCSVEVEQFQLQSKKRSLQEN